MADRSVNGDGRLDEAFDRIMAHPGARLSGGAVARLLVLLANGIAVQRETAEALASMAAGGADGEALDAILRKVEDSREGFHGLVAEIADGLAEARA